MICPKQAKGLLPTISDEIGTYMQYAKNHDIVSSQHEEIRRHIAKLLREMCAISSWNVPPSPLLSPHVTPSDEGSDSLLVRILVLASILTKKSKHILSWIAPKKLSPLWHPIHILYKRREGQWSLLDNVLNKLTPDTFS